MNLKDLLQQFFKHPFGEDTILQVRDSGNHILSSGRKAGVLTDERLKRGDNVITVTDENNQVWILSGKK